MSDVVERFVALISAETRGVVASVIEHAIEREYGNGSTAGAQGASLLALTSIKADWRELYEQMNGNDKGLTAAADQQLRVMVRDGLLARRCQCPVGTLGHAHAGLCEGHTGQDVPERDGRKLCGPCYNASDPYASDDTGRVERTDAALLAEGRMQHPHHDVQIARRDERHVKLVCRTCLGETYVRRFRD